MKNLKWRLITISLLVVMLDNLALAEGDGGGDSGGDSDGSGHYDGDGHHHHWDHSHGHNHFSVGIGGYYDPWLWGGYYNPGFWGGYYNPGFFGPGFYGYRAYGYADPFFRPYYAYPPAVAVPSQPPVYIQQQKPTATQSKTNYWHYCRDPEGYYPYIKECPGGWLQVVPQPYTQ